MRIVKYKPVLDKSSKVTLLEEENVFEHEFSMGSLSTQELVYKIMEDIFRLSQAAEELVYLLAFGREPGAVDIFEVAHGTTDLAIVRPREIFQRALLIGATRVVLVHNHPSQRVMPSDADIAVTKQVKEIGIIIGLHLEDHIIVGNGYYSFKEQGML